MAKLYFQMGYVPYTFWECMHLRSQECTETDKKRGGNRQCIDLVYSDQGQLWQSGVQI